MKTYRCKVCCHGGDGCDKSCVVIVDENAYPVDMDPKPKYCLYYEWGESEWNEVVQLC